MALVPASGAAAGSSDGADQLARPAEVRGDMAVCSAEFRSYAGRVSSLLKGLAGLSNLVPVEAECHSEVMDLVTEQRMLSYVSFRTVCQCVGTVAGYEKNVLSALKLFWDVAQEGSVQVQKKNVKVLLQTLESYDKRRIEALELIKACEQTGVAIRDKNDTKVYEKAQATIKKFSGGEAVLEATKRIEEAMKEKKAVEAEMSKVFKQLSSIKSDYEACCVRFAMYESMHRGEKGKLDSVVSRASELARAEHTAAKAATQTSNTKRSGGFWFLSWSEEDNEGDRAREKANTARDLALVAKQDEELQANRVEVAGVRLSKERKEKERLGQELRKVEADMQSMERELQKALMKLEGERQWAEKKRAEFGGVSLYLIGQLSQHLQELPALLTADAGQNDTMFKAIETYLDRQEALKISLEGFASGEVSTDEEALAAFNAVKKVIRNHVATCEFVTQQVDELNRELNDKSSRVAALADAPPQTPSATERAPTTTGPAAAAATQAPLVLKLEEDDDDLF